jgi:hypothetical protein
VVWRIHLGLHELSLTKNTRQFALQIRLHYYFFLTYYLVCQSLEDLLRLGEDQLVQLLALAGVKHKSIVSFTHYCNSLRQGTGASHPTATNRSHTQRLQGVGASADSSKQTARPQPRPFEASGGELHQLPGAMYTTHVQGLSSPTKRQGDVSRHPGEDAGSFTFGAGGKAGESKGAGDFTPGASFFALQKEYAMMMEDDTGQ